MIKKQEKTSMATVDAFKEPIDTLFTDDAYDKLAQIEAEFGSKAKYVAEVFLRSYAHVSNQIGRTPTKEEQKLIFDTVKRQTERLF